MSLKQTTYTIYTLYAVFYTNIVIYKHFYKHF